MEKNDDINFVEPLINDLDYNSNNYIYFICTYFKSLDESVDINSYIKSIRKSITYLEKQFNDIFLLIGSDDDKSIFVEKENRNLFNCLNYLVELLGENEFITEADRLNQLKTKISLGYDRYFVQENSLVSHFDCETLDFEIYSEFNSNCEINVLRILDNYLDKSNFKEFKTFSKYLDKFPKFIYQDENLKLVDIKKSLFFNEELEILEFEENNKNKESKTKNKIIKISDFDNLEVMIKCLELFNLDLK
ncbi:MAG: hypothetical protein HRU03_07775 [Nanoarchaeales archaeon]|nr:hypothetical protein [Nanoarchaeales archaeon]